MIVYLFLAAAYPVVGFSPYWLYVVTGYVVLGVPAIGLMVLNRRYLVPQEYALYGELMRGDKIGRISQKNNPDYSEDSEALPSSLNNGSASPGDHEAVRLVVPRPPDRR
jgi:hypothetical protein